MILPTPEQKAQWKAEGYLVFENAIQGRTSSASKPLLIIGQTRAKKNGWIESKPGKPSQPSMTSQTHLKRTRFSLILSTIRATTAR